MIVKQENSDNNYGKSSSESEFDELMKMLLKESKFKTMETVISLLSNKSKKYKYYLNKMQEAKKNQE